MVYSGWKFILFLVFGRMILSSGDSPENCVNILVNLIKRFSCHGYVLLNASGNI